MKKIPPQQLQRQHLPVLLEQALQYLDPQIGESYLDLTAGYGGHAGVIITKIGDARLATLVDRDETSITALRPFAKAGARVLKNNYADAASSLHQAGERFDMILIDLGVSSPQLDIPERGFSFRQNGPLDMRMDQQAGFRAEELLNRASKDELTYILRAYGEEPKAAAIAQAIIHARPLKTTVDLTKVVEHTVRGKWGRIHPATRTFQAIRIAVNDELGQIERTLPMLPDLLKSGGRLVVISFHSLEDRLVKRFFKEQADAGYEATLQILTKHSVAGQTYDVSNPRARSAKLRAAVKIKK